MSPFNFRDTSRITFSQPPNWKKFLRWYQEEDLPLVRPYSPSQYRKLAVYEDTEYWYNDSSAGKKEYRRYEYGKLHSIDDKPAFISYNWVGDVIFKSWYDNGQLLHIAKFKHRLPYIKLWYLEGELGRENDLPAIILYKKLKHEWSPWHAIYEPHEPLVEEWRIKNSKGESTIGRVGDKPAIKEYDNNGKLKTEKWFKNGIIGRGGDKPAKIDSNLPIILPEDVYHFGTADDRRIGGIRTREEWYIDGKLGRLEDNPARIGLNEDGDIEEKEWLFNGRPFRKDDDKPTTEKYHQKSLVRQEWRDDEGRRHRPWKPAVIRFAPPGKLYFGPKREYWWRGHKFLSKEAFDGRMISHGFAEPNLTTIKRDTASGFAMLHERDQPVQTLTEEENFQFQTEKVVADEMREDLLEGVIDRAKRENESETERLKNMYPQDSPGFVAFHVT